MNKHLSKYLTHEYAPLREWVKSRINLTDQRYEVIEKDIDWIPEEHQFTLGFISENYTNLVLNQKIIYGKIFHCEGNNLTKLPELPVCERLYCGDNRLIELPELPFCKELLCNDNHLTSLPELPVCEWLECENNQLITLPKLLICKRLYCENKSIN